MTDDNDQQDEQGQSSASTEPLACVSCRSRKLKCDRTRPACTRCVKIHNECVYPESRRKPTFKRRNVKELEARLAQVEDYLKEATKGESEGVDDASSATAQRLVSDPCLKEAEFEDASLGQNNESQSGSDPSQMSFNVPNFASQTDGFFGQGSQLISLGFSEALPPFEVMEELNNLFFLYNYHFVPVVHSGRFYQAFYGSSLKKPPMCLQYAIWAMASIDSPKYQSYSDVFYQRARHYAEADEMRDEGEHFITISHAQMWIIIASYEAKRMLFTRAALSSAKSVRLVNMMGLHLLDGGSANLPPALLPATSWIEVEERRRIFWGAFMIDCHASISTGWPNLINSADIMTRLPASEDAFASGQEEKTAFLDEAFSGAPYGGFSGAIISCQVFKDIFHHVHKVRPEDKPADQMEGQFWKRHRDIDNKLSRAFMFLPEKFRLPQSFRDPSAVHINLSLHAAIICLHHAALEMAIKHNLSDTTRTNSLARLKTSAEEVATIIKMTSHATATFSSSPFSPVSLYCATTVYIYLAKEDPSKDLNPVDKSNLELIMHGMQAVARVHKMTDAFVQQVCMDIESNGLSSKIRVPFLDRFRDASIQSHIPLLARSSVAKHSKISSVLPGRLPLHNNANSGDGKSGRVVTQQAPGLRKAECFHPVIGPATRNILYVPSENSNQKRKRVSTSPGPGFHQMHGRIGTVSSEASESSPGGGNPSPPHSGPNTRRPGVREMRNPLPDAFFSLPDRTSSSVSSPANRGPWTEAMSPSTDTSPGIGLGNTAEENRIDLRALQDRISTPLWQNTEETLFAQFNTTIINSNVAGGNVDQWGILDTGLNWDLNPTDG